MNKLRKYGIILTTIMTIFTSSLIVAKAAGTQATIHTLYKSNTLGTAYEYVVISVEFADYTSGTIIISVDNLAFYDYIVFGARLSNVYSSGNTRRLTLQVDDCKQVIVYCLPHAGDKIAISPSIYSNSTSYVEHVNQSFIEEQFTTTDGYIDDLESTCNSIYTDVHNIYLQLVDQALDLDNIQSQLTSIGNYLNTTNSSLTTLNNSISLIMQQIQQIDYQIDTISWNDFNGTYTFGGQNTASGDWTDITSNGRNSYIYTGVKIESSINSFSNYIVWLHIPIYDIYFNKTPYLIRANNAVVDFSDYCYIKYSRTYTDVYIYKPYTGYNGNGNRIVFQNAYYNYPESQTATIKYLASEDIEYWQLLQSINQFKYQTEQLNLTQELKDIVSQLSSGNSTETTTNITNFNTNMEIVNNIETNLSTDFGNSKTIFEFNESDKWTFDEDLIRTTNSLNSVFTATINALPPADTWLSLILLCAVLLAILG